MSHALNRMRWMLKDRLFVRTPAGMIADPAGRSSSPYRSGRRWMSFKLALEPETFSPSTAETVVSRLPSTITQQWCLRGPIVGELQCVGARASACRWRPSGTLDLPDLLDRGELDPRHLGDRRSGRTLRLASAGRGSLTVAVHADKGHPAADRALDRAIFAEPASARHFLQRLKILRFVDAALAAHGQSRFRGIGDAVHLRRAPLLARSDMVAVLGRQDCAGVPPVLPRSRSRNCPLSQRSCAASCSGIAASTIRPGASLVAGDYCLGRKPSKQRPSNRFSAGDRSEHSPELSSISSRPKAL